MIRLEDHNFEIQEAENEELLDHVEEHIVERPSVVDAKVYKLRSGFVRHSVYITLGWIEQGGRKRPIEIFINSKDLTKSAEYAVLTRLLSAIFRKSANPEFILEELGSIQDPNGGYHRNGKYVHSFYSEIADVIRRWFADIGLVDKQPEAVAAPAKENGGVTADAPEIAQNSEFQLCPDCSQRSVKMENGCLTCVNPECGYSKCDK